MGMKSIILLLLPMANIKSGKKHFQLAKFLNHQIQIRNGAFAGTTSKAGIFSK
jgi:hypothetical protein